MSAAKPSARRVSRTIGFLFLSLSLVGLGLLLRAPQAWPAPWLPPPALGMLARPAVRRGKVYIGWGMAGGLCNQLNSHVNGLALALALGADAAVLPWGTRFRANYNHTKDGGAWGVAHLSTLFDVDAMRREWAARGLELHVAPRTAEEQAAAPWINCATAGAAAFAPPPGEKYLHGNLITLVSKLRLEIADVWAKRGEHTCIVVQGGNLFNAFNASSTGNLTVAAAAWLRFNTQVEAKAAKVARSVKTAFNGAHLRIEPDMGLDFETAISEYMDAMKALNFSADKPMYIASGLLTYNDTSTFDKVATKLRTAGLCSKAVAKEQLLPAAEFEGLHSEQLALLDLLALTRSAALVGHKVSTFSLFVRDYRTIRGGGNRSSVLLLRDMGHDVYLPMVPAPTWP